MSGWRHRLAAATAGNLLPWLACLAGAGAPRTASAPALAAPVNEQGYRLAVPPYHFAFPRDHASHPDYQTEWWYYTGHLAAGARRFGYELTFFRVGIPRARHAPSPSAWATGAIYFSHFALTEESLRRFRFAEAIGRGALGLSGADTARYHVWVDTWSARLATDGRTHELRAQTPEFAIALDLTPLRPPVSHGEQGVSVKAAGPGHASHYYSLTRLATRGRLTVGDRTHEVSGVSWMDHEYGSNALAPGQRGWDWFGLELDDGRDLMLYRLRDSTGAPDPASSGTLVGSDGRKHTLGSASFSIEVTGKWRSPKTGGEYPAGWIVRVPSAALEVELRPTVPDQELVTRSTAGVAYWEGSVFIRGTSQGRPISGAGYVELTGYAGRAPGF
jgi:predicted secreted hydrolase